MKVLLLLAIIFAVIYEILTIFIAKNECAEYVKQHCLTVSAPSASYCIAKRLCDIIISLMVCLLILPILYLFLGLIIKLTSRGPVIFKQQRYGYLGKKFVCYKFRSMYQNAGPEKVKCPEDKRITPIGRFIRKTHLDEFPQFFNVLKGDMSVVGPRPEPGREIKKYLAKKEGFVRLIMLPGITGLAQINSGRLLSDEDVLHYDFEYVSRPSLIKDFCLIIQTLKFSDVAY